jgi:hypothetical protein
MCLRGNKENVLQNKVYDSQELSLIPSVSISHASRSIGIYTNIYIYIYILYHSFLLNFSIFFGFFLL